MKQLRAQDRGRVHGGAPRAVICSGLAAVLMSCSSPNTPLAPAPVTVTKPAPTPTPPQFTLLSIMTGPEAGNTIDATDYNNPLLHYQIQEVPWPCQEPPEEWRHRMLMCSRNGNIYVVHSCLYETGQ